MHRFFIETENQPPLTPGVHLFLPTKLAHQVRDVLHLVVGEQLILLDNSGDEIYCAVTNSSKTSVEVQVVERQAGKNESSVRIMLCQGLLKSARFEWILEKGTELGVSTFAPTLCQRSMAGLEDTGNAKIQRWQRILQEATEQCERTRRPELLPIRPLKDVLDDLLPGTIALMAWEEEQEHSLRDALQTVIAEMGQRAQRGQQPITVVLFIGPEGGLSKEEVELAQRHCVQSVTLGTRILRAETAALVAVANVLYELEVHYKK
jgi:16S rRNA (uracil1498-N3)-methyltransferase